LAQSSFVEGTQFRLPIGAEVLVLKLLYHSFVDIFSTIVRTLAAALLALARAFNNLMI
jgi:hypothetical protein